MYAQKLGNTYTHLVFAAPDFTRAIKRPVVLRVVLAEVAGERGEVLFGDQGCPIRQFSQGTGLLLRTPPPAGCPGDRKAGMGSP